jgi:hypothetical protein
MIPRGWIISHRCSWMAVYVSCCNAQSKSHSDPLDICTLSLFYQLLNCNFFTQHVVFILWRDTTSELWTPVQFPLHCYYLFALLALFTFSHTTITFHSIRSFLCLQQTGGIDNLIVSWEQSSWLCCAQVPRCCWRSKALYEAPYKLSGAVAKLASITFLSLAFSYWINIPWFHN